MITLMLIFFIFFAFFIVVFAGTAFYGLNVFHNAASNLTDITIGNISFEDTYDDTLGAGLETVISTLSKMSFALVLGMIVVMLIIGFKMPHTNKLWIILDIFIIVVAFIVAVYLTIIFNSFINSDDIFLDIYSTQIQSASTYLLNLPLVITVVGALIMIVTYISRKKRTPPNVLEFQ